VAGRARRALTALALLCASAAGSLVLADLLFRLYERTFWIEEVRIGAGDFDLEKLGYNDAFGHVPAAKPAGEFRILSFGDSFAESATRGQYAYAKVLADALAESSGRPVRVVNFGISRSTFQDYIQEERTWGERVQHDAVLFNLYAGNDFAELPQHSLFASGIARAPVRKGGEDVRLVGPGVEVPRRYPLRFLDYALAIYLTHTQPSFQREKFYRDHMPFAPRVNYIRTQGRAAPYYGFEPLERAYGGSLYGLDALVSRAAALERQGMRVAISVAPPDFIVSRQWLDAVVEAQGLDASKLRFDLPDQIVAALAARRGFQGPIVSFQACLREAEAAGQDTYWATNTHWSARGNEIVGRVYAERLAAAWDLGAGKVETGEPPPPCDSSPPAPSPEVVRWLDAVLPRLDAATRLRNQIGAALSGDIADFGMLARMLESAGLRHEPTRFQGQIDSASPEGVGRVKVRVSGIARDLKDAQGWRLVGVVRAGELRGIGLATPEDAPDGEPDAFSFDVLDDVASPRWGFSTLAVVVSPDGAFAELPFEAGVLGGRRAH
jgi:hypothetical protein